MEPARCFRCHLPGRRVFASGAHALVRCERCSMAFVSPHPSDEDRIEQYQQDEYFDEVYVESRIAREVRSRWEQSRLALASPWQRPGARMLEAGCGRGTFLKLAVDAGWDGVGVEISKGAAEVASVASEVQVCAGTLEEQAFEGASFDVVCGWDVIEHVPDPSVFLAECYRLLRPEGGLLLSCPNVATWPPRVFRGRWWTLKPDEHLWHFEPATLRKALIDAGFKPARVITSPWSSENLLRFDSLVAVARKPA